MNRLLYLFLIFYRLTSGSESKKTEQHNCASPGTTISSQRGIKENEHCEQLYQFGIKQDQEESTINIASCSNGIKCNSQHFEIKQDQEESTINIAPFSNSIECNSQHFENKQEQEEYTINIASFSNGIECNSQHFKIEQEQEESTIGTHSFSKGIKFNSQHFRFKHEQEESTIRTHSFSKGIKCNSQRFGQDANDKMKSRKRKCPESVFLEQFAPNSPPLSIIYTQYNEDDGGTIYSQTAEAPKNIGTVNDHDQQMNRYMFQDQHIDRKSNIHTPMDFLNIPDLSTISAQSNIPDHTSSYTCPLERIIVRRVISPERELTDEVDTSNARANDEISIFRKRYGHEAACGMNGHNNFEIKNIFDLNKRLKDDSKDISCTYNQISESSLDERIQSIHSPDTSYIKQPISLKYIEAANKGLMRTENTVQDIVTNFNPFDIRKKQGGSNDAAKYKHSTNSIPLTDTLSSSENNTLDRENFLLTIKMISLLDEGLPGYHLLRLSCEEISLGNGKKSSIYNKYDALTSHTEVFEAYKTETTFFLFSLYFRATFNKGCSGRTIIIIPMVCQGFCQYDNSLELESNIISKCEGYIIMTVEIICTDVKSRLTKVGRHHKVQIVIPADEKYGNFLKDLFLIKHGGQRLMMECRYINDSKLRFTIYRPPTDETLKTQLESSSFISRSKLFIKQVLLRKLNSTTISEPFRHFDTEVSIPLIKQRGEINNPSINECLNNDNSRIVEKKIEIGGCKEGVTDHHNHSTELTSPIEALSDQDMIILLQESFLLTGEAIDRLRKNYPISDLFEFSLVEFSDKSSMKGGFFLSKKRLGKYPTNGLPGPIRTMFILYALFTGNPLGRGNTGKCAIIMPWTYKGFVQYNHLCKLRSKFICSFNKYFVINFHLTFMRHRAQLSQKEKKHAVLIIRAEEEHSDFLKNFFFIMHAGQGLIMYMRSKKNHELRFSVYKAPGPENLSLLLENSQIISRIHD